MSTEQQVGTGSGGKSGTQQQQQQTKQPQKKKEDILPPTILRSDMSQEMQTNVIEAAKEALVSHVLEKDQATAIKKKMESLHGGIWHCIAGTSYGVSVTNQTHYICFFKLAWKGEKPTYIVAFQSLDEETYAVENEPKEEDEDQKDEEDEDDEEDQD
eukprot:gb/GECG01013291.1/.p1 GENE.gb/GECG01013291.1/~~gb/GECG01013291.1/.p1  ORF type:complete len:157 (+),score=43.36 gb/GECG01013291.1/:1-471(+)